MRATMLVCVSFFVPLMSGAVAAEQIVYNFTVVATDGPLAGTTAHGSLAYDSNGPTGGVAGLLTALSFTWHGVTYGPTSANTGWLFTGIDSGLSAIDFGTNCKAGSCEVLSGTEEWALSNELGFDYSVPGSATVSRGTVSFTRVAIPDSALPIPGVSTFTTLMPLCLGIFGIAFAALRARRPFR